MSYKIKQFHLQSKVKAFKFLMVTFDLTMGEAQRWIDRKRLFVNDIVVEKKSVDICGKIEVFVFTPSTMGLLPIFQTDTFALFDKPSGVLVHSKNRDTEYSLTHEVKFLYGNGANIVHRLDRETSGLVIVAKNKITETDFKLLFENRKVAKSYVALAKGRIAHEIFIDAPILKNREFSEIKLKVHIDERGKPSQTIIKPLTYFPHLDQTLVEATPLTGRQHQIRIHLFHIGHPIVGDPIYGVSFDVANRYLDGVLSDAERILETGASRVMLHAQTIQFSYPNRFDLTSKTDIMKEFNLYQKIPL